MVFASGAVPAEQVQTAVELAAAAAARLRLEIRELTAVPAQHEAAELLRRIWHADTADQLINRATLRALQHAGNYVAGAYRDGVLVAAAIAFFGSDHLHSHITGVDPAAQSGGVGYALKQHQRAWCLARGITEVRWTFDPLVRRNAYVNLHKLGGRATAYLPDFYGEMNDGINTGEATDRLYLSWELLSAGAQAAARGDVRDVDLAVLRAAGGAVLLDRGAAQEPRPAAVPLDGRPLLVAVPDDVVALRERDPAAAVAWRLPVREALCAALDAGYRITGMSRDGWYTLEADR
ncbi:GNAT family N-acetyltransferase [Catellatospora sp. KI3]|uniref:GNAT family N-acetyltransferase n=1 Tax=Catellatospora sp. KI3 TaxID=3041620 RepID=UPI002482D26D|nr:GNAT family N-acetyltransferase [Catellatospora sp. KI3]MDI1465690.1 GNAT family N-acetyltransferase [Catellatospora sp. KI3]